MVIDHLNWDSEFFGIKTGRILWQKDYNKSAHQVIETCKNKAYKLVYIFCDNSDQLSNFSIKETGATLYDEKVTFHKSITGPYRNTATNIKSFKSSEIPDSLYRLGLQSGEFSRFKIDKHFQPGKFEALYNKWVENSVNRTFADEVLVAHTNSQISGFCTVKCKANKGIIGLIAVDTANRGNSIGTTLIQATENYLLQNQFSYLSVVTQLANKRAVNFYRKNNFEIKDITNIYHLWIS